MGTSVQIVITARVQQDGIWWDISVNKTYDAKGYADLVRRIRFDIAKLSQAGCISTASFPSLPVPELDEPVVNQEMENGSLGWPAPQCLDHQKDMKLSTQQRKQGKIRYYCSKKLDDGYCSKRCDVDEKTGVPDHWEVNG